MSNKLMIGAATAPHQVEGNNLYSDSWAMEHMQYTTYAEPSLDAVDHYHRFEEDMELLKNGGLNAYRFGIEWARIEPENGRFDEKEILHYKEVLKACRDKGIMPVVTLHHFSSPKWLIEKGGWEADTTPAYFARYTQYVMDQLGQELSWVCTINEANMGLQIAAIAERFKKQMQNASSNVQLGLNLEAMMQRQKAVGEENKALFGTENPATFISPRTAHGDSVIIAAHMAARNVIRKTCPHIKVGLSLSLHDVQFVPGGEALAQKAWEDEFLHYLPFIEGDDFLGVQNYTRNVYDTSGELEPPADAELTQMKYEFYPQALEHVLERVAKDFHGDLIVTENGIATADDTRRIAFIEQAMTGVQHCVEEGLPVRGYFYWSLLDNFEWSRGFSMTFGLIAVDRATQKRTVKPSLSFLGSYSERL